MKYTVDLNFKGIMITVEFFLYFRDCELMERIDTVLYRENDIKDILTIRDMLYIETLLSQHIGTCATEYLQEFGA